MREALLQLMDEQAGYRWEVLFVDDGSKDRTLSVLEQMHSDDSRFSFVSLSRNFGKEVASSGRF